MNTLILLLVITAVSCFYCHTVARRKNRSPRTWLVLALLFGPFAVLAIFLLPPVSTGGLHDSKP